MKIPFKHDKTIVNFLKFFFFIIIITSCSPSRNLTYFSDLQESTVYRANINNASEPRIQPDDLLGITVSTLNAEFNTLFNSGVLLSPGNVDGAGSTSRAIDGFLVDKEGFVSFPAQTIGKIKLAGLTKEEAKERLVTELKKQVRGTPIVNLRFLNFKVTVMGEVNRPNSFIVPSEKITILEALSQAGDMTVYGKRENVLLIREKGGLRNITRINLNSKEALNSPYFYLQQNDVVYVEAHKSKLTQTTTTTNRNYVSMLVAATSIVSLILSRVL